MIFFMNVRLSIRNYNALLIAWSVQSLMDNVRFDAGDSIYCSQAAQDAHDFMIINFDWRIVDKGRCQPQLAIVSKDIIFTDENNSAILRIITTDPDFDNTSFAITGGEDQAFFSIDSQMGLLSFINLPDFENPLDHNNDNSYIVEVTVIDDGSPVETDTQTLTVYIRNVFENLPSDHFVTTWKTDNPGSSNDSSIHFGVPIGGGSYNVDWNNDGIFDEINITGIIYHDFGTPGIKTIRIVGDFYGIRLLDKEKIISIDQWGTNPRIEMSGTFSEAINLVNNAADTPNLSAVGSLSNMFFGASLIGSSSEQANWNWDTKNVFSMKEVFKGATSFNQNIANWDTSGVSDMSGMFENAIQFNQNIGKWDTRRVRKMPEMFKNASAFDQNIGNWNTARVTDMEEIFADALLFNQDIGNWDTSHVYKMQKMFFHASLFNQDIGNWDTSHVRDMESMFSYASSFNQYIGNWDTIDVRNMESMFSNAFSFNQDIGGWDTSQVSDIGSMFFNASSFNQDLSSWNVQGVVDFEYMFTNIRLSVENYDALLISWSTQYVNRFRVFDGGNSVYCSSEAQDAHDILTSPSGWRIYDKGACSEELVIVSDDEIFTNENRTFVTRIFATKVDFDNITYTITGGDDQTFFIINSITGELSFINPPDYENPLDINNDNAYIIEVAASDDGAPPETTSKILTIYVNNVFEDLPSDHFVTTWKTDNPGHSNDTSILISVNTSPSSTADYLYNVDWDNDGVFDEFGITGSISHDFGIPGIKTIRISGQFPQIIFRHRRDNKKIISIDQWGSNPWKSMESAFFNASNLINNAEDTPNLSMSSDLSYMFWGASLIGSPYERGNWNWNTSHIFEMSNMFKLSTSFNQNIGNWNTSGVSDMSSMFNNASSFNQDLSQWNVQRVFDFSDIFVDKRLSVENYDALLTGWNAQNLLADISFNGGDSIYCSQAAQDAHDNMIATFNWSILDGGTCEPQLTIVSNSVVEIEENHSSVIKILTTDPDFDTPSFMISGGADETLFSIDSITGLLSFKSPPDFENPISVNNSNTYSVEVTAIDYGIPQEFASQLITVIVTDLVETSSIDLNIQVTTDTTILNAGDSIEFSISISNEGLENAVNAIIFDLLPSVVVYSTWTCSTTGTATCSSSGSAE
ncbi:MAG: BspA family leucine-rich repeat surface protein, partial [Gammaproteobacteria bacterium]|nr:BspA family leucine-rich repeat surface protein [Gammaproteobacteria bacterium]